MNSKILGSMFLIGLVALSAVGGTWAYFSDTEQSLDNVFTAGVIDLQVDATTLGPLGEEIILFTAQDDGCTDDDDSTVSLPKFFNYCSVPDHDIKPGNCGEVTISLHVGESNDADLGMSIINVVNNGGANPEPEQVEEALNGVNDALSSQLLIVLWQDSSICDGGVPGDNIQQDCEFEIYRGSLEEFGQRYVYNAVGAGETVYVGFYWEMNPDAGNEFQGDNTQFDVLFTATQLQPTPLDEMCDGEDQI